MNTLRHDAELNIGFTDERAKHAAQSIMRAGQSANTVKSYRAAMEYWDAWHQLRFGALLPLPTPAETVIHFVLDHFPHSVENQTTMPEAVEHGLLAIGRKAKRGPLKLSSVKHRLAVLSKVHKIREFEENPCDSPKIKELLSRATRNRDVDSVTTTQQDAMRSADLMKLIDSCDDSLIGLRDRAILYVGWASGGRRRSELAGLQMRQLRRLPNGDFELYLEHTKTNQNGSRKGIKPVFGRAAIALQNWLKAAGIVDGNVFRRLDKGQIGASITGKSISQMVKNRAISAGLSGNFAAHSLRAGFVTEAGARNIALGDVMALTEHRAASTVLRYYRNGAVSTSDAAKMLG